MRQEVWGATWVAIFILCGFSACSNAAPPGAACQRDSQCVTDLCVAQRCAETCTVAADCSAGQCVGRSRTGQAYCAVSCASDVDLVDAWYCDAGQPRACEDGGSQRACYRCGCPAGDLCNSRGECETPRGVGETCYTNEQCLSRNCGAVARDQSICFVAAGAPCDGTNCGECARRPDGTTACLQACNSESCPGSDPARSDPYCWGDRVNGGYYCRLDCNGRACPDGFECQQVRDNDFVTRNRCFPINIVVGPATFACDLPSTPDHCGVCDGNPSNDCVQDCAGTWGGSATMDRCGVCDTDATNDCTQDCAGVWGGPARMDPCGVCDADPANDGYLDPCGVCDGIPTNDCVPACRFGSSMLGACWFLGLDFESCAMTCSGWGGVYSEQTRRVAGSEGSEANCLAIVRARSPSVTGSRVGLGGTGLGCTADTLVGGGGTAFWHASPATNAAARDSTGRLNRVCACEF